MPKKIPLHEWARRNYDPMPSDFVLRRWCRDGEISPQPERVGRGWYVLDSATRGAALAPEPQRRLSLVERLQQEAA